MGYQEEQAKWIKENDIKVGDKVKVLREFNSYENNCHISWRKNFSDMIGNDYHIEEIDNHQDGAIRVGGWYLPYFVLQPVKVRRFVHVRGFKDDTKYIEIVGTEGYRVNRYGKKCAVRWTLAKCIDNVKSGEFEEIPVEEPKKKKKKVTYETIQERVIKFSDSETRFSDKSIIPECAISSKIPAQYTEEELRQAINSLRRDQSRWKKLKREGAL